MSIGLRVPLSLNPLRVRLGFSLGPLSPSLLLLSISTEISISF